MVLCRIRKGKLYKVNKKRMLFFLVLISALVTISSISAFGALGKSFNFGPYSEQSIQYATVAVVQGDSLWNIAKEFCGSGHDLRETIDIIYDINGLEDSLIYPGQNLLVPIFT